MGHCTERCWRYLEKNTGFILNTLGSSRRATQDLKMEVGDPRFLYFSSETRFIYRTTSELRVRKRAVGVERFASFALFRLLRAHISP